MDFRTLNNLFEPDGRIRTQMLPDSVVKRKPLRSDESKVVVHEYHIDDTIVFVPDGSAARNAGSPTVDQSVDASLAIQGRVNQLGVQDGGDEISVLIYTPNAADAQVAVLAGYANGVKTVAVDDGQALPVPTATDFGRDLTARGGEIRGGGEIITIREDLGIGSPVSLVEVDVTRRTAAFQTGDTAAALIESGVVLSESALDCHWDDVMQFGQRRKGHFGVRRSVPGSTAACRGESTVRRRPCLHITRLIYPILADGYTTTGRQSITAVFAVPR